MLTNPVIVSVLLLLVLCLLKFNVLLSILVAAMVGGWLGGIPLYSADGGVIDVLIAGTVGNAGTALSYILLGAFAVGLARTGLGTILSRKLSRVLEGRRLFMVFSLAFIACFSQNLVPVHIAFIPILIPPLLGLMNRLKLDRRAVALALTFGLKAPYIVLPVGFGLIFQKDVLVANITDSGLPIELSQVTGVMWIAGLSMLVGLIVGVLFLTRKDREYEDLPVAGLENIDQNISMNAGAWGALVACIVVAVVSILTESLPYAATAGIFTMIILGAIKFRDLDNVINEGIGMMGFIAFVMLVASGYAAVLRETGAVEELVATAANYMHGSKMTAAFLMLVIGLFITMGIGTSFGTVPIIAAIYVPLAMELGFSPASIILLVGVAGALGDAGSPASDSTLGPTSGLNADGQHDHIWDTTVPTFIAYNIPLIIGGVIGTMILG